MPDPEAVQTPYGAKIEAAVKLLKRIQKKGEQAILFVQYDSELKHVENALSDRKISAVVVDESRSAGQKIKDFREAPNGQKQTVIVLNASDETAAGSNLQNANHVVFLSPPLRESLWEYKSSMHQAIGRVCRPGQNKRVHIYRIVALNTIDVDILEHRERRSTALTEKGTPDIVPPPTAKQLDLHDEAEGERTQLVREHGRFSLRPHSWLLRRGADEDTDAMTRVKEKHVVAGWERFGSLVKFSRRFTQDDEN